MPDPFPPVHEHRAIGLIPARGGSKGIPLKNITPLLGNPLIHYVIAAGQGASGLQEVVCSTDHEKIAHCCRERGVTVIDRPAELAQDDSPVTPTITHVLQTLLQRDGTLPGFIALLQPTSPLLQDSHIAACLNLLRQHPEADSAQTITPVSHHSHAYNQRVFQDGVVSFRFLAERQGAYNKQRKPVFYQLGNVIVSRTTSLLKGMDAFGQISVGVPIERRYSVDVDSQEDIEYAEYLLSKLRNK